MMTDHDAAPDETASSAVENDVRLDDDLAGGEPTMSDADATMRAAAKRIEALDAEVAELRERWVRSEAEAQNIRARAKRDVEDARQFAVQKFARDVVEAAENLRRGLASLPAPTPAEDALVARLRDGFEGVERSFLGVLDRNGIKGVDPTGERFDANLHQAMSEQNADAPAGTVLAAWTSSWTLNGRLLKPAMVVVSKGPASDLPATDSSHGGPGAALDTSA